MTLHSLDAGRNAPARRRPHLISEGLLTSVVYFTDFFVIVAASVLTGIAYHLAVFDYPGPVSSQLQIGCAAAVLFTVPLALTDEYTTQAYLSKLKGKKLFEIWNLMIAVLLVLGFILKITDFYSRGAFILFYLCGLPAIIVSRFMVMRGVRAASRSGLVSPRRLFLIGDETRIASFMNRFGRSTGVHVVATAVLTPSRDYSGQSKGTGPDPLQRELETATSAARAMSLDAVLIVAPWFDHATIERCVDAFQRVPVEIHLGPERIMDRFEHLRISKFGPLASLQITRKPLTTFELVQKRVFDIVIAAAALVLLFPLFVVIAALIKLDSAGPVLFFQRRYGFNQKPFRIIKFRTMMVLDDGDTIVQARRNDPRITRVGSWLRRANFDELPQLANVLRGEMSLVGPRPHALAHNRAFEQRIDLYARRHNVKPGITGLAQVNGCRGQTETDEMMNARVIHDLHYIDNWSMWLDAKILALTLVSPMAYINAR